MTDKVRLIGYTVGVFKTPLLRDFLVEYIDYERLKVGIRGIRISMRGRKNVCEEKDSIIEVDMDEIVNWRQIFLNEIEKVYIVHNESFIDKAYNWYCRKIKNRTNTINNDLV